MNSNQPVTEDTVPNGNEKETNLDLKSDVQKDENKKCKEENLIHQDKLTEKPVAAVNEEDESDDKRDYDDYEYDYPHYSYEEEIYNFIHGTPDEQAVEEYLENNNNWMEE